MKKESKKLIVVLLIFLLILGLFYLCRWDTELQTQSIIHKKDRWLNQRWIITYYTDGVKEEPVLDQTAINYRKEELRNLPEMAKIWENELRIAEEDVAKYVQPIYNPPKGELDRVYYDVIYNTKVHLSKEDYTKNRIAQAKYDAEKKVIERTYEIASLELINKAWKNRRIASYIWWALFSTALLCLFLLMIKSRFADRTLNLGSEDSAEETTTGKSKEESNEESTNVRPWLRFWAKNFDMFSMSFLLLFIVAIALPYLLLPIAMKSPHPWRYYQPPVLKMLSVLITLVIYPFFEATIMYVFGTTLGKWLFNINVTPVDGSKRSFSKHLLRAYSAFILGMGFGIPIVSLITEYISYTYINKKGYTMWDKKYGFNASYGIVNMAKTAVIAIFFAGIFLILTFSFSRFKPY